MHKFFLKIPWWIRKLYSSYHWKIPTKDKILYLTFDDGPHPTITPWVLAQLKNYGAKATFFCIGKNVLQCPTVFQQLLAEGHAIGNHTHSHCNGWRTPTASYLADVARASEVIDSSLFRPPYGRIRRSQAKGIAFAMQKKTVKIIMWDVLSADFDQTRSPEQCAATVLKHASAGSIIVFHDSEKAFENLKVALPLVLKKFAEKGFAFEGLETA